MVSLSLEEIVGKSLGAAYEVFPFFAGLLPQRRADLMKRISINLGKAEEELLEMAAEETHLQKARLKVELKRTMLQWNQYADACVSGEWMNLSADEELQIRKMNYAIGPIVVFGASNFPFAYSTPGGDTASALAAGCPVIVKAHPAHAKTSLLCAEIIAASIAEEKLPAGIFHHIEDAGFETGAWLVKHPLTAGVAFTGSFKGGKALYDMAQLRANPIPVFAEMGSTNPVVILPGAVEENPAQLAKELVASLTGNAGQFCTNPGLWFLIDAPSNENFFHHLREEMKQAPAEPMLHPGIAGQFRENRKKALMAPVSIMYSSSEPGNTLFSIPTIAYTQATNFLANKLLREEIFGPYALAVLCANMQELAEVLSSIEGQLTGTIRAAHTDLNQVPSIASLLQQKCGRLIFNGVPTGVAVTKAMHHGGPFPATTDARFTAVGADSICRFVRPLCYQGWPSDLLPHALQQERSA